MRRPSYWVDTQCVLWLQQESISFQSSPKDEYQLEGKVSSEGRCLFKRTTRPKQTPFVKNTKSYLKLTIINGLFHDSRTTVALFCTCVARQTITRTVKGAPCITGASMCTIGKTCRVRFSSTRKTCKTTCNGRQRGEAPALWPEYRLIRILLNPAHRFSLDPFAQPRQRQKNCRLLFFILRIETMKGGEKILRKKEMGEKPDCYNGLIRSRVFSCQLEVILPTSFLLNVYPRYLSKEKKR